MNRETLKVVPILNGKNPGFDNWPNMAAPLSEWPAGKSERWGMVHGPVNETWVLDIDIKGTDGHATLAELERKHGRLPPTLAVTTPSGGIHLIFKWPRGGGIGNRVGFLPGLDTRGENGQSLVPPSPGYLWDTSAASEPADAPMWLLSLARKTEVKERIISDPEAWKEAALRRLAATEPGQGQRQATAYTVAKDLGRLAKATGESLEDVITCVEYAARACGLEEHRIGETVPRAVQEGFDLGGLQVAPPEDVRVPARPGMSMADFLAIDHPPLKMLVEPYVSEGAITVVYGAPGSLKTWFALDVARQAAERGRRVLIIQEEGRPGRLAQRFQQLGLTQPNIWTMVRLGVRLDDDEWLAKLEETIKGGLYELVVMDPFADMHQLDENEQKEMRRLVERIKTLAKNTGTAIVLVHHTTKAGWVSSKDRDQVGLETLRGAGSLGAALDMAIQIVRDSKISEIGKQVAYVHVTKDKDGIMEIPNMFPARMTVLGQTHEAKTITWESGLEVKDAKEREKIDKLDEKQDQQDAADQKLLNIVRDEPNTSTNKLSEILRKSYKYTQSVLARLESKGLIERVGKGWQAV